MNTSIHNIFLETKVIFEEQAKVAVQEALEKVYAEYLPHVENDTYFNVAQKARGLLVRFMDDSLDEHDKAMLKLELQPYTNKNLRIKMFQDNKEELTKTIGQDIIDRVIELEQRYAHDWEFRYE